MLSFVIGPFKLTKGRETDGLPGNAGNSKTRCASSTEQTNAVRVA